MPKSYKVKSRKRFAITALLALTLIAALVFAFAGTPLKTTSAAHMQGRSVVYFNQSDSRWANTPYGSSGSIGESGCGPTALAIAVSTLKGEEILPTEVASWASENGYRIAGSGSLHSLIPDGARHYGLQVQSVSGTGEIRGALQSGGLVVALMGKGDFTSSGHFIVLRDITKSGKILVADPQTSENNEKEWDLPLIITQAKASAAAGGPFWALSK